MSETPNLALPLLAAAQAQKHVTHNEALLRLDVLTQLVVIDRNLANPPASPSDGQCWIVGGSPSGAWANHAGEIAAFQDGAWMFYEPRPGWKARVLGDGSDVIWTGSTWEEAGGGGGGSSLPTAPHGANIGLSVAEEELTLSGASVQSTIAIPDRAIVFAVTERVTATVTGASSFSVGIAGEATKFGNQLGLSVGSVNIGVIGPTAFYQDTPIVVAAIGGDFTGGKVRIAIHYATFAASTS
jgi:hypothetical protein